jgi:hypothetical protein
MDEKFSVFGPCSVRWKRCLMCLVCVDLFGVAYVLTKALVVGRIDDNKYGVVI